MPDQSEKIKSIFGNKKPNRLRSPDQLQSYISVTNPSIWAALVAIIVFLLGVLGWCVFGRIPITVSAVAVADEQAVVCLVKADSVGEIQPGNTVSIDKADVKLTVASIAKTPTLIESGTNPYICSIGNFASGEYVYEVMLLETYNPGIYSAQITTSYLSPLSFILN